MTEIELFSQTLNIFFDQFLLPLVSHIREGIFYLDPESCFIMNIRVLLPGFLDLKEGRFFPAFSISYNSDEFPELKIKNSCLFSEFSGSGFFYGFSYSATSFGERNLSRLMTDAEQFCVCSTLASADTTSTWLQPKEGRDITFYVSEIESNKVYFLFHRGIV